MGRKKRDSFEVSSDRKRKRTWVGLKLSPLLEDNLAVLFIGFAVFSVVLVSVLVSSSGGGEIVRPTRKDQQAHLAVIAGPSKTFAPGSTGSLEKMTLSLKNLGPAAAENVKVFGLIGNQEISLIGPGSLGTGEQQDYKLAAAISISPSATIVIKYLCWNCPLTPGPAAQYGNEPVGFEKERQIMAGEHKG